MQHSYSLFVCWQDYLIAIFTKFGGQDGTWAIVEPLDTGGCPDHVSLRVSSRVGVTVR